MAQNIQVKKEYEEGILVIHTAVFRRLIENCVDRYRGMIRIAKYKGDIPDWLQKVTNTEYLDAMDFAETGRGIAIRLVLVVSAEADFPTIAHELIASIKNTVLERTETVVDYVELVVSGYFFKNSIRAAEGVSYTE